MTRKFTLIATFLSLFQVNICLAEHQHQSQIFHNFILETDAGNSRGKTVSTWDLEGWVGSNNNKLWLKSEGETIDDNKPDHAEFWAMYSRNIQTFWDGQIGLRRDEQPDSVDYLVLGLNGLAPYFFETDAHLFISEKGNFSARIRQENDLLITQKLITQPYFELNFSGSKIEEQEVGKGFTDGSFGLQTRYEFTKRFAPYIDFNYIKKFAATAKMAEDKDNFIASLGLRLKF
ncbi:MAG: copper resistance protein B [Pseudomonadota bacterium]